MTGVLMKRGNLDTKHTQGEYHVDMRAEIGAIHQTLKNTRMPADNQKMGERHETNSLQLSEGTNLASTLISNS